MRQIMALLLLFLLPCCAHFARMNEVDVMRVAKVAAENHGYKIEQYEQPEVRFTSFKKDRIWTVFYRNKENPLVHFLVVVYDETGNAKVMPGE